MGFSFFLCIHMQVPFLSYPQHFLLPLSIPGFFFFLPLKKGLAPAKRKTHILICPFLHTLPTPAYIAHTMSTYVYMYKFFFSLGVGVLGVIYSWVFFSLCRAKRGFYGVEGCVFLYICIQRGFCFLGISLLFCSSCMVFFVFSPLRKKLLLPARRWFFILFFARGDCLSYILRFLKFSFFFFLLFYVFRTPLLSPRSFRYVNTCPHLAYTCIHLPTCVFICFHVQGGLFFSVLVW